MMFLPYSIDPLPNDSIASQHHKYRSPARKKKPTGAYQHKKKSVRMAKKSRRRNRK